MREAMLQLQVFKVVISSPGVSLSGENVMAFVERTCQRYDSKSDNSMVFGYDSKGSTSADERDGKLAIDWSDGESVKRSFWFKGYRESVKGQVKVLCQVVAVT